MEKEHGWFCFVFVLNDKTKFRVGDLLIHPMKKSTNSFSN